MVAYTLLSCTQQECFRFLAFLCQTSFRVLSKWWGILSCHCGISSTFAKSENPTFIIHCNNRIFQRGGKSHVSGNAKSVTHFPFRCRFGSKLKKKKKKSIRLYAHAQYSAIKWICVFTFLHKNACGLLLFHCLGDSLAWGSNICLVASPMRTPSVAICMVWEAISWLIF